MAATSLVTPIRAPRRRRWRTPDTVALALLTLMAGAVRLYRLSDPGELIFDEVYYARDACHLVEGAAKLCGDVNSVVHPPLGKWIIGAGIEVFGFDAFGWRIAAVVAGTLTVALLFVAARMLLASTLGAALSAGLLACDFLHFVQSRVAMLDIFVPLFGVAALLFAVMDRGRSMEAVDPENRGRLARPWRATAGACAGAAVACKWSGISFLLLVILLTLTWEVAARKRRGRGIGDAMAGVLRREVPSISLYLAVVPVAVYLASHAGQIDGALMAAPWSDGSLLRAVAERQQSMFDFHVSLDKTHGYQSPAWSWILLRRPVSYYFDTTADGAYLEIIALGNPFVWWPSIASLLFVAYRWVRRRDFRGPEGAILAGFILTYGPWLIQPTTRPALFMFYLLPAVPFMCIANGYVATRIGESWEARVAVVIFAAVSVGLFYFFYPILAKRPLTRPEWERRILFTDCAATAPKGAAPATSVETTAKATITRTTAPEKAPPEGWCWI